MGKLCPLTGRVVRNLNFLLQVLILLKCICSVVSPVDAGPYVLVSDCSAELSGHRQSFTLDIHGQLTCKSMLKLHLMCTFARV